MDPPTRLYSGLIKGPLSSPLLLLIYKVHYKIDFLNKIDFYLWQARQIKESHEFFFFFLSKVIYRYTVIIIRTKHQAFVKCDQVWPAVNNYIKASKSLVSTLSLPPKHFGLQAQPPTVVCKMEAQLEYIHIACMHVFACLALICMLSQWLLTKISASEFRQKFIKSALLVGHYALNQQAPRTLQLSQNSSHFDLIWLVGWE